MDKPIIIVSGNYHFTNEELFEISDSFPIDFEVETHAAEEFQAEDLLPLLRFVFEHIAVGILRAIGKEIWDKTKKITSHVIGEKETDTDVEFAFRDEDTEKIFKVSTKNKEVFESAFNQLIDKIKHSNGIEFFHDEYVYNVEKGEWEAL